MRMPHAYFLLSLFCLLVTLTLTLFFSPSSFHAVGCFYSLFVSIEWICRFCILQSRRTHLTLFGLNCCVALNSSDTCSFLLSITIKRNQEHHTRSLLILTHEKTAFFWPQIESFFNHNRNNYHRILYFQIGEIQIRCEFQLNRYIFPLSRADVTCEQWACELHSTCYWRKAYAIKNSFLSIVFTFSFHSRPLSVPLIMTWIYIFIWLDNVLHSFGHLWLRITIFSLNDLVGAHDAWNTA